MTDVLSTPELPLAFAALLAQFQSQCTHAQQIATLAGTHADAPIRESDPMLQAFAASVQQLEEMLRAHEAAMTQEEAALQSLRSETLPALRSTHDKLQEQQQTLIEAGLEHVTPAAASASARQPLATKTNASNAQQQQPKAPGSSTKKGGSIKGKDSAASSSSSSSSASSAAAVLHPDRLKLDAVSAEEFATIPAYMRANGRLDRSKLNAGLEAFRAAVRDKYAMLSTPMAQLNEAQLAKFTAWSDADATAGDSETAGQYWLGAEDLRAVPALQALGSINLKAVLVGLRHLGRIKNSTATGAPKYIVVQ